MLDDNNGVTPAASQRFTALSHRVSSAAEHEGAVYSDCAERSTPWSRLQQHSKKNAFRKPSARCRVRRGRKYKWQPREIITMARRDLRALSSSLFRKTHFELVVGVACSGRAGRYDLEGKGGRLNAAKQSRAKTRMKLGAPRRRASARWVGEVCCEICAMNAMPPPPPPPPPLPRASKLITRACGN